MSNTARGDGVFCCLGQTGGDLSDAVGECGAADEAEILFKCI